MPTRPETSGDPLNKIIAATLYARKEALGLSYPAIAAKTGLSRITVIRIMGDQVAVRIGDFAKIAAALGLNAADALEDAEVELAEQVADADLATGS